MPTALDWMPATREWRPLLKTLAPSAENAWTTGVALANLRLDFLRTNALDIALREAMQDSPPSGLTTQPIRLALLGSCTLAHLHSAIRVAGLRRGIWISIYENAYGQYWRELADRDSPLHQYKPTVVLLAFDAYHLAAGFNPKMTSAECEAALREVKQQICDTWRLIRETLFCPIIQQTPLPVHPLLLGNNEHRLPGSPHTVIERLNSDLRQMADSEGIALLALDKRIILDGIAAWHDAALWHRAKQEISPLAAPLYGDLVGRILAAQQGRSYKCLVLDLDNTLWGGVIGEDGIHGLVLGQGSALGEAFVAFQKYVRNLSQRGIILAVCSKNDELNALEVFENHPEMILRRNDIASFVANWNDKASNIRAISKALNIGLDSIVFLDDNPVERDFVRRELPMVAVPEIADDPASYPQIIANAGYFEGLSITEEDRDRSNQYQSNLARETLKNSTADLSSYLSSLEMRLMWRKFDHVGLQRITQLINKTNQFNLTTRRYTYEDLLALALHDRSLGLQLRLIDKFGDNGIIGIIIGRLDDHSRLQIDTWLMSCRVLGRQVELATLNLVAAEAKKMGASSLLGEYIQTKKNEIVRDHYSKLGFSLESHHDAYTSYTLDLATFKPPHTCVELKEG